MHITEEKLRDIVIQSGLVKEAEFVSAAEESKRTNQSIQNILIGRGFIMEDYLSEMLSEYFKVPVVNLKKETLVTEVIETIPEAYAKSRNVILYTLDKEAGIAKVAMIDPFDYETIEFLRARLNLWIEPRLATLSSIKYALKQYKKKIGQTFAQTIAENIEKSYALTDDPDLEKTAAALPIIAILNSALENAILMGASDVHFEPFEEQVLVRYRIDGIMHEIFELPKIIAPVLVARVKVLANLHIDEHSAPQDGRFKFEIEDATVDIRVSVMPVFHGEKVEMRILKSSARPLSLAELGLSVQNTIRLEGEIKKPHGMVLVTGPTGHGKTTTLYAILHLLNTPNVNITTIEDPIEYEVGRINQTQVNAKAGITFANGLRSLLRQNPDIIMIGEIRDSETVDIAVHAALTGHLVLSSLHTNDASSAVPRLIDMGAQPFLLSSTINVVVAQRLVRKICVSCIESYSLTEETKKLVKAQMAMTGNEHITERAIPTRLFRGKGCKICNNAGYHGQIGIFEILPTSEVVKDLILKSAPTGDIKKQAISEGMKTMFEDGLDKVEKGITTLEEILRVIRE